jgi:hypothetical protein
MSRSAQAWARAPATFVRAMRGRTWEQRRLLLETTTALAGMKLALGLLPFRLVRRAFGFVDGEAVDGCGREAGERAAEVATAVLRAARRVPWESTCLTDSLAVALLLRRRGIGATLYLGVGSDESAPRRVAAHAWLRCGDQLLTGAAEEGRYKVLAAFAMNGR